MKEARLQDCRLTWASGCGKKHDDWLTPCHVEVRSYFTTDGQSVSQSLCLGVEHPLGLATRYSFLSVCCCLKFAVLFLWSALSDKRTGLQFTVQSLNGPSHAEPATILYCLSWDSPNLKGQVPVFKSLRNRVAQLYPWALGSLYVASCYPQGYTMSLQMIWINIWNVTDS
jgi:hypothetical protein